MSWLGDTCTLRLPIAAKAHLEELAPEVGVEDSALVPEGRERDPKPLNL